MLVQSHLGIGLRRHIQVQPHQHIDVEKCFNEIEIGKAICSTIKF